MAETIFITEHHRPTRTAGSLPGRIMDAIGFSFAELSAAITEARSELRLDQAMRGFDRRQLRDIGLDRGAC